MSGSSRSADELERGRAYRSRVILGQMQTPAMVSWVFRHSSGLLKTERQAAYTLLGIVCLLCVAALGILVAKGLGPRVVNGGPGLTPAEIEEYKKFQPF